MKKQALLTAVASLLTFASVAVLPAFAAETGGQSYNPMPRQEYSRYGGDHERHHDKGYGRYGYGYSNPDSRTYGSGSGYGYGKDKQDKERYEQEKSKGSGSGYSNYGSGYGYRNYGYGNSR